MSAYIVEKLHVLYLVEAAMSPALGRSGYMFAWYHGETRCELRIGDYDRAAEVANMLWRENIKSVSHRYPGESSATLPGPGDVSYVVEPKDFSPWMHIDPVQVLKACDCFSYQSCEHDGWRESEAHAFVTALQNRAWRSLPGYEAAVWGAPPRGGVLLRIGARAVRA